jgi:hypothetical protein
MTNRHDERIVGVRVNEDTLSADLADGRTISVPLTWFPRLLHATPEARANWQLAGGGFGIHWPDVDEDLSSAGLLRGNHRGCMTDNRHILGITVRVAVQEGTVDPQALRQAVQCAADDWSDGRMRFSVELALDGCERLVKDVLSGLTKDPRAEAHALDNDTTVALEGFPTLKQGAFRVICESSAAESCRAGYELATRTTFDTFEEAERYADGISYSRSPRILVEVERGSS